MREFFAPDQPCPCDTCERADLCYAENLACMSFKRYALDGENTQPPEVPTREIWDAIYMRRDKTRRRVKRLLI